MRCVSSIFTADPEAGKLDGGCSGSGKGTCSDQNAECTGGGAKKCRCKAAFEPKEGKCGEWVGWFCPPPHPPPPMVVITFT